MIEVTKKQKEGSWVLSYIDPNDGEEKDLIVRPTEAEIVEIATTPILGEDELPLKDEEGNIKTIIHPYYLP